jgi:hypothetical protein
MNCKKYICQQLTKVNESLISYPKKEQRKEKITWDLPSLQCTLSTTKKKLRRFKLYCKKMHKKKKKVAWVAQTILQKSKPNKIKGSGHHSMFR